MKASPIPPQNPVKSISASHHSQVIILKKNILCHSHVKFSTYWKISAQVNPVIISDTSTLGLEFHSIKYCA